MTICFDEVIGRDNFRELGERHVRETLALLDGGEWPALPLGGASVAIRDLEVARVGSQGTLARAVSPTLLGRIDVRAPRSQVFPLLAHPTRAPEWDSSDRGFAWVECFDDDHTVFNNFNQPPLFGTRDSVIYRVERSTLAPDRSLYCARSVVHPRCPPTAMPRILQQVFAWDVRDTAIGCEVRVLASTPENMLPPWLFRHVAGPGWRSILRKLRRTCEAGVDGEA